MNISIIRCLVLLIIAITGGCGEPSPSVDSVTPHVIRIAPLPDTNPENTRQRYQPLINYIETNTGIKTELVLADSYDDLLDLFHTKKIDIANFGGVTFIKARKRDGAKPMVKRVIDSQFTSVVLVRAESHEKEISELQNKSFAFGSKLSTSGNLMPRYFFKNQGISPESFFSRIEYSGAHDKTAYMVRDKLVYAGVSNASIVNQMYRDGRLKKSDVRILWETPNYTDYLWAIQSYIAPEIKGKIENAFLNLQVSNPEHKLILEKLDTNYFITANQQYFVVLENILDDFTLDKNIK